VNKVGRPKKNIDPTQVKKLAAIQCSYEEIASVLNCSVSTIIRNFDIAIKEGRENGKASLKRLQWKAAERGSVTMMIWLGKQYLGQSDKAETTANVTVSDREEKANRIAALSPEDRVKVCDAVFILEKQREEDIEH